MAKGMALSIGLNAVDSQHYSGWQGILDAAEADAASIAEIIRSQNFIVETLLTQSATRDNVSGKIGQAAQALDPGDIFC